VRPAWQTRHAGVSNNTSFMAVSVKKLQQRFQSNWRHTFETLKQHEAMSSANTARRTAWSCRAKNSCWRVFLALRLRFKALYFIARIFQARPASTIRDGEICRFPLMRLQ